MPTIKPRSYWNEFANVERELQAFIARHGVAGTMPNHIALKRAGYGSLSSAIKQHGGYEAVAQRLGLQWTHTRKPNGYWADFENVERELRAIIAEIGQSGIMPTEVQFRAAHRSDLVAVISKYGGLRVVATRLGLKTHQSAYRKAAKEG